MEPEGEPVIRVDLPVPTIDCCGILFEYDDHDMYDACPICGQEFDWVRAKEMWEQDYDPFEHYVEDPDSPPWSSGYECACENSFDDVWTGKQLSLLPPEADDEILDFFKSRPTGNAPARPPTAHLPNYKSTTRKNIFLVVKIPDEVL